MKRFLAPLGLLLVAGTVANAQTVTRTYSTSDGFGNSTTTTVEAPASVAGLIAGQTIYGGFPGYAGGVPSYAGGYPSYNTYPAYGDGYGYPVPYGYYGGQAYYIPGQVTPIGTSRYDWAPTPTVTTLPQLIIPGGVPCYPNYGYAGGYGYSSNTTVARGSLSYQRGGLGINIGGSSVNTKPYRNPVRGGGNRRSR